MVYSNNSAYALYAMENERTGGYGADYDNSEDFYDFDDDYCDEAYESLRDDGF